MVSVGCLGTHCNPAIPPPQGAISAQIPARVATATGLARLGEDWVSPESAHAKKQLAQTEPSCGVASDTCVPVPTPLSALLTGTFSMLARENGVPSVVIGWSLHTRSE